MEAAGSVLSLMSVTTTLYTPPSKACCQPTSFVQCRIKDAAVGYSDTSPTQSTHAWLGEEHTLLCGAKCITPSSSSLPSSPPCPAPPYRLMSPPSPRTRSPVDTWLQEGAASCADTTLLWLLVLLLCLCQQLLVLIPERCPDCPSPRQWSGSRQGRGNSPLAAQSTNTPPQMQHSPRWLLLLPPRAPYTPLHRHQSYCCCYCCCCCLSLFSGSQFQLATASQSNNLATAQTLCCCTDRGENGQ
jgi:hypothetical protein